MNSIATILLVFAISNANSFKRYKSNPGSDDEFHRESHVLTDIPAKSLKCQVNEKGAEPKEVICPPHSKYCNYIDRNGVVTRNCSSGKGKWPSVRCVKLSWFTSCLCKGDNCNIRCSWDNCTKIAISRRVNSGLGKAMYNCNANCKAEEDIVEESEFVPLNFDANEKNLEVFKKIFHEPQAEIISRGHKWTEGPVVVSVAHEKVIKEILYYSDVIEDKIWKYEASEFKPLHQSTVVVSHSGGCDSTRSDCELLFETGSNGLAYDKKNNNLLICQHGARAIAKMQLDPSDGMPLSNLEIVADFYGTTNPRRFNSPNDIAIHPYHNGRIFFTDPPYGLIEKSRPYDGLHLNEKRDLPFNGVYEINNYLENSTASLIDAELFRPNGVVVSPDGKMLYVSESCTGNFDSSCSQGMIKFHQYTIDVSRRHVLPQKIGSFSFEVQGEGASDGFKIHKPTGLIVSSCPSGLCIIKPMVLEESKISENTAHGELIVHIKLGDTPTKVSNLVFGSKFLFVTGDTKIWRIKLSKSNRNS